MVPSRSKTSDLVIYFTQRFISLCRTDLWIRFAEFRRSALMVLARAVLRKHLVTSGSTLFPIGNEEYVFSQGKFELRPIQIGNLPKVFQEVGSRWCGLTQTQATTLSVEADQPFTRKTLRCRWIGQRCSQANLGRQTVPSGFSFAIGVYLGFIKRWKVNAARRLPFAMV